LTCPEHLRQTAEIKLRPTISEDAGNQMVLRVARETGIIITAENNVTFVDMGSAVCKSAGLAQDTAHER
jgi:transketolase C-terminal domain/subunit